MRRTLLAHQEPPARSGLLPLALVGSGIASAGGLVAALLLSGPAWVPALALGLSLAGLAWSLAVRLRRAHRERDRARAAVGELEATRLLAGISQELLASSLDYESTLRRLAELVVPRLADIAAVYLVEDGAPRRVEVVHANPEAQAVVRRLASETSDVPPAGHPVRQVIEDGQPRLVQQIDEQDLPDADPSQRRAMLDLEMGSAMILPLRAGERTLGALVLVTAGGRRRYDGQDLEVAVDLAGRAAMAMENARLHQEEREARRSAEGTAARLARLQRITTALAVSTTMEEVADAVLGQAFEAFGASSGSLAVIEGRMLRLVGTAGIPEEEVEHWRSFSVDAPVPLAEAVRSRSSVLIADPDELASEYPHLIGPAAPSEGKAWAALPLLGEGEPSGVLSLTFPEPRSFPEEEERFLQIVAQECAQALERARLYEAERTARTEAVRQQERLNFLAEASEILAGSLRYERTLEHLLELCVPRLADWCIVDVAEPEGSIEQLAVAHVDPDKTELIRELRRRYPPDLRDHPIPRVIRSGSPEFSPEIPDEELVAGAEDEEHVRLLRELGVQGHMVVPLPARGGILGTISFVSGDPERRYSHADLALAEDLARRAALALDNARLYRERSRVARALQESLLPSRLPLIDGVELAARYRPAGAGSEIGGDFYDVFEVAPDRWAIAIGDVAGRGPEAGALTALTRYTIRTAWLEAERDPADILRILNDAILREEGDRFCTLALGLFDLSRRPGILTVASGGHPPPLLLRADGFVEPIPVSGMLLGAFSNPEIGQAEVETRAGDALVLYTDGIVDAGRQSSVPVEGRLIEMLKLCVGLDAELIANRIQRHVSVFEGSGADDDAALVVVRLTGGPRFG